MQRATVDARAHLLTLVDRPITGFRGGPMTVLEIRDRTVLVRTRRAPEGTAIPVAWVQRAIDLLLREGEIPATAEALGRRRDFLSAVLLTLPGAAHASGPPGIALRRRGRWYLPALGTRVSGRGWPLALLASSVAVALTTYGWTSSPFRPLVTTWFLLACPGIALVRLLPRRGALTLAVLAIATSLALETLVAEAMLESNLWSPRSTLAILLAVTVAGAVAQLRERSVPAPDRALLSA
jgi:hypothetical protein